MFIVLEGVDGCGKSTQARLLQKRLAEDGFDVLLTAEPAKNRIGSFIREVLSGKERVEARTLALLFTADRYEHLQREVEPALSRGWIVICERYYHSTIAYQAAQGVEREWLVELNRFAREPDITIYLDMDPEKAMKRTDSGEIFENADFLARVYEEYKRFDDLTAIDASVDVSTVSGRILDAVSARLKDINGENK